MANAVSVQESKVRVLGTVTLEFVPDKLTQNNMRVAETGEGFNKLYLSRDTLAEMGLSLPDKNGKVSKTDVVVTATVTVSRKRK